MVSKNILQPTNKPDEGSNDFANIFLGKNQVPITDVLIDNLVEEKGIKREELIYLQKEGAS